LAPTSTTATVIGADVEAESPCWKTTGR
jgi:hypothetical protein